MLGVELTIGVGATSEVKDGVGSRGDPEEAVG